MKLVSPGLAVDDTLDLRARDAEVCGEPDECSYWTKSADVFYVLSRQLGLSVSFARLHCSVAPLVVAILLSCSPAQVFEPVVVSVTVKVSSFMVWRTRPDECLKHKSVHVDVHDRSIFGQPDLFVVAPTAALYSDHSLAFPLLLHQWSLWIGRATIQEGPDLSVSSNAVTRKSTQRSDIGSNHLLIVSRGSA